MARLGDVTVPTSIIRPGRQLRLLLTDNLLSPDLNDPNWQLEVGAYGGCDVSMYAVPPGRQSEYMPETVPRELAPRAVRMVVIFFVVTAFFGVCGTTPSISLTCFLGVGNTISTPAAILWSTVDMRGTLMTVKESLIALLPRGAAAHLSFRRRYSKAIGMDTAKLLQPSRLDVNAGSRFVVQFWTRNCHARDTALTDAGKADRSCVEVQIGRSLSKYDACTIRKQYRVSLCTD
eukprot:6195281-Pleurochrysis_carterae.AAC.5